MRNNLFSNIIIVATLCISLVAPVFALGADVRPISTDLEVKPIIQKFEHWAKKYVDQLTENYELETKFKNIDLDSAITIEDFEEIVRLTLDHEYNSSQKNVTREAVVHEFTKLWAKKTGNDLDNIVVIQMLIYADTDKIDPEYNHSVTVAYMNGIAKGSGAGLFNPKSQVTYGELATLIVNTLKAIENEQNISEERFETRGSCILKDDKVIFDFELLSHYTAPRTISFSSGQQFELTITDDEGNEVYKFSDGKFFTMAIVSRTINPGESFKWQDEWDMTNKDGDKLSSEKYRAEISILVMSEDGSDKAEKNQLNTTIDFDLKELKNDAIKREVEKYLPEGNNVFIPEVINQSENYQQVDIDKDGIEEIGVFYEANNKIGVVILENTSTGWELKDQIAHNGNNMDYVGFNDLDGDNHFEMLIGDRDGGYNNNLTIYKLEDNKYKQFYQLDYYSFSIGNINGDGIPEIASIIRTEDQIPSVKLLVHRIEDNTFKQDYETELQYGDYPDKVLIGAVKEGQQGIFVELGLGAHSALTEIVIKEDGVYKSVLAHEDEYNFSQTFKPYPLFSTDINNDGIMEVGIQFAPPETEHLPLVEIPWINKWYQWDGKDGLTQVMEEYSNNWQGYRFTIPKSWYGKYTINEKLDKYLTSVSVDFIYVSENNEKAEFLTLHHISKSQWTAKQQAFKNDNKAFMKLGENSENVIVAELKKKGSMLSDENIKEYNKILVDADTLISTFKN